jgi:hypothetical protein
LPVTEIVAEPLPPMDRTPRMALPFRRTKGVIARREAFLRKARPRSPRSHPPGPGPPGRPRRCVHRRALTWAIVVHAHSVPTAMTSSAPRSASWVSRSSTYVLRGAWPSSLPMPPSGGTAGNAASRVRTSTEMASSTRLAQPRRPAGCAVRPVVEGGGAGHFWEVLMPATPVSSRRDLDAELVPVGAERDCRVVPRLVPFNPMWLQAAMRVRTSLWMWAPSSPLWLVVGV